MDVIIEKERNLVHVYVKNNNIDGDNSIFSALKSSSAPDKSSPVLVIDFNNIEYINSLGITEIINIHRYFSSQIGDSFRIRIINVDRKIATILELVELSKIAEIETRKG